MESETRKGMNGYESRVGLTAAAAAVILLSAVGLPSAVRAVEVDGIVARVGEDAVLRSEVILEMQRRGMRDGANMAAVVNEMVDRRLILKAAHESKMTMQEWVVENRVREIVKRSFGGDRNKLIETLSQQKVSYPEWYAKTKEDMIVGAMRWNVVDKNVTASPAAMKREYEEHKSRYTTDHLVSVTVILLKPEEAAKRDEISAALKTKSFEDLGGKKYENIKPEEMFKPEVVEEIEKMPKGTISHWIEIDGWSFLLRKDKESAGRQQTFAEAYDAVEAQVKESEAKRLYEAWIARLRAETYVKVF